MAGQDLQDVFGPLEGLPFAAVLTDLATLRVLAVNDRAAALFGVPSNHIVGSDLLLRVRPDDREAARAAYAALADMVVDGYQVQRTIVTPDGKEVPVSVWCRRVGSSGKLYALWVLVPGPEPGSVVDVEVGTSAVVLAVTDHDWLIEYMSADAHLLGVRGTELRGFPLLGLVHPSAASGFLVAAARTATEHVAVSVLTRIRVGADQWAERRCMIVRMCEHEPPRLGVVFTAAPQMSLQSAPAEQIDDHVRQCALEARARQTLGSLPALAAIPACSELSARQTEIVTRLIAGQRVPEIARLMFLSPSTVRNHLAAIYKKFGVHSQTELLAALLRAARVDESPEPSAGGGSRGDAPVERGGRTAI